MVLVDTSVWIRLLAGREPFASGLEDILDRDDVLAHDLVEGELAVGDRGGRPVLLANWEKPLRTPALSHHEVLVLVRSRKLNARGIGWTDAHVLASALKSARQQHDDQDEEDDSAETTPDSGATDVESAAAEQQQKDDQYHK